MSTKKNAKSFIGEVLEQFSNPNFYNIVGIKRRLHLATKNAPLILGIFAQTRKNIDRTWAIATIRA